MTAHPARPGRLVREGPQLHLQRDDGVPAQVSPRCLERRLDRIEGTPRLIGASAGMERVRTLIAKVAPTPSTVLILGETGTGKELVARAVHEHSPRAAEPFVAINCAAIPETLIENELFGHERGAFTGASDRRQGKFELASGGTVFLDEIGELPLGVQGKLLRAIEEKVVDRIGGRAPVAVDVRVVAATNKDLKAAVDNGQFRGDLFFRLAVFPIEVPPLRGVDEEALAFHRRTQAITVAARRGVPTGVRRVGAFGEIVVLARHGHRRAAGAIEERHVDGGS